MGHWRGRYDQPVYCGLGQRISKMKSSQTREWIEKLLSRSSSDVAFARSLSQCDHIGRRRQRFGFATTEQLQVAEEDMAVLCHRVLYEDGTFWNGASKIMWNLMPSRPNRDRDACFYYSREDGGTLKPTNRLDFWPNVLERFGPLQPDQSRLCLRKCFSHFPLLDGRLEAPTSHEQLEARLELRAWAKAHLPPDVQTELERLES